MKYNYSSEGFQIRFEELEDSFKARNLEFYAEKVNIFADKWQNIAYVINNINNAMFLFDSKNKNCCRTSKDPRFNTVLMDIEVWAGYLAVFTISLADVLALFVQRAFDIQVTKSENVYFDNIFKLISEDEKQVELLRRVKDKICRVKGFKEYRYIKDLANYIKHNNVIDSAARINFSSTRYLDVFIKEFEHSNRKHPKTNISDLVEYIYKIHRGLIDCFAVFLVK